MERERGKGRKEKPRGKLDSMKGKKHVERSRIFQEKAGNQRPF